MGCDKMDSRLGLCLFLTLFIDSNDLLKCTRPEYQGTYIECPKDENQPPVKSCYKTVNKSSGEVNKGCAPSDKDRNEVYIDKTGGPYDEFGFTTYYCNTRQCNGSGINLVSSFIVSVSVILS